MKRSLSFLLVFSMLLYHLLPLNALAIRYEPETPVSSSTEYTSTFSSTLLQANGVVYGIDANSIFRFRNGQRENLYQLSIDTEKGFCTNGRYAYVAGTDGAVIRVDLVEKIADRLFVPDQLKQIVGAGKNGLYLALIHGAEPDWWGYDLYSFDFSGMEKTMIAAGVNTYMDHGYLVYQDFRSDVSPARCWIVSPNGETFVDGRETMSCLPIYLDGSMYYLDVNDVPTLNRANLISVNPQGSFMIAQYACDTDYGISCRDGIVFQYDSSGSGEYSRYSVLNGQSLPTPTAEPNSDYRYSMAMDRKTTSYYYIEAASYGSGKPNYISILNADGTLQRGPSYLGSEQNLEMICDSYAYFRNYNTGEITCAKIEAAPSGIPDNTPEVIQILVENRDVWMLHPEYMPIAGYRYGLIDFEGDGIPELYCNHCEGSGRFSNNKYYKVDLTNRTVSRMPTEYDGNDYVSYLDLYSGLNAYWDKEAGRVYYLGQDLMRSGAQYYSIAYGFLHWDGSQISVTSLWLSSVANDVTSYSFQGQEVADEATWTAMQEDFLADYIPLNITFTGATGNETEDCNDVQLAELLTGMYNDFYGNRPFEELPEGTDQADRPGTFAEYFLNTYPDNLTALNNQISVGNALCQGELSPPNWSNLEANFSNETFISRDLISSHPELYYETLLMEGLSASLLDGIRQTELEQTIETEVATLAASMSSYNKTDSLSQGLGSFTEDSEAFQTIRQHFTGRCEALTSFATVQAVYNKAAAVDNGTLETFFRFLAQYATLHQANTDAMSALLCAKAVSSEDSETTYITAAIDHLNGIFEANLDSLLASSLSGSCADLTLALMNQTMTTVLEDYGISGAEFYEGSFLSLFTVLPTERQYGKLYGAYALEMLLSNGLEAAITDYSQSPSAQKAAMALSLYDLIHQLRSREVQIATQQYELLEEDRLLDSLRNLIRDGVTGEYLHGEDCIRAYVAYGNELVKEKAHALHSYTSANVVGEQPVQLVYLLNGKVYGYLEDSALPGTSYSIPWDELTPEKHLGMKATITSVYTDEAMTLAYDESQTVYGPLPLFCKVDLVAKDTKKPVVMDPGTGIYVPKDELPPDAILDAEIITKGPTLDDAVEHFDSKPMTMYHINMLSHGTVMEPDRSLTIHIPVNEAYSGATIYRVEEDGSFSKMDTDETDGFYRFKADKLGTFAVVYEEEDSGPDKTILAILLGISVVLLVLLISILVYIQKKR